MVGGMNRYNSRKKALRKQRIDRAIYSYLDRGNFAREHGYYDNLHQYSKNKIHCSCPLCSAKVTKYKGRGIRSNYTISDQRKFDRLMFVE